MKYHSEDIQGKHMHFCGNNEGDTFWNNSKELEKNTF